MLWRRGESAVNDLVAAMPEGETLAYNSVLTTIRILEQKGTSNIVRRGARLCIAQRCRAGSQPIGGSPT